MGLRSTIFLVVSILCLTDSACFRGSDSEVSIDAVQEPIATVTGAACPFFEDQIFRTASKDIFAECDLRKSPREFNGKLVRVRSRYAFMIHGSFLSDPAPCPGLRNFVQEAVWVGFRSEADYEYVDGLRSTPIDILAVGQFLFVEPTKSSDTIYDLSLIHI